MRRGSLLVCIALAVVACDRSPPPPTPSAAEVVPPAPAPSADAAVAADDEEPEPCPKTAAPASATATPQLIASGVLELLGSSPAIRWIGADEHVHELGADLTQRDLGSIEALGGWRWDERYAYRLQCFEACEDRTSAGVPRAVVRVDRKTGKTLRLGKGDYGAGNILPYRGYVYWGTSPHERSGGVYRIRRTGGDAEMLWSRDFVRDLVPYDDGILIVGKAGIAWLPAGSRPATAVFRGAARAATVTDDAFYVAERGDPYWQSADSGFIHRIPRRGGAGEKLVGPVRWPQAIAVHGDRVYYMLSESAAVWSVPTRGGPATIAVPEVAGPSSDPCQESKWLAADDRGLFWLRTAWRESGSLYHAPWAAVR